MNGLTLKIIVLLLLGVVLLAAVRNGIGNSRAQAEPVGRDDAVPDDLDGPWEEFTKPAKSELQQKLDALQYRVTQQNGTEPPFRNEYWDNHDEGIYVDVVSGEPLFSSLDKYESGSGWPSFTRPLVKEYIEEIDDSALGMRRVELRSRYADSHLGHVFDDGPAPTGLRYCINSASLRFVPVDDLDKEGYGDFVKLFRPEEVSAADVPAGAEVAILAGGCFWGMEDIIREIPGVIDTQVGYSGGSLNNPAYSDVSRGKSGHAESVRVLFDPARLDYAELLGWFFRMHDPTTPNRQGNDRGTQYRSAIFATSKAQRDVAEKVKAEVDASGKWSKPIVTEIVAAGPFYDAEDYHQDYLEKNPNGYTCHFLRD